MNTRTPKTDNEAIPALLSDGSSFLAVDADFARSLELDRSRLMALVEDVAGDDCYHYDKHLSPKPCGKCRPCTARALLAKSAMLG